MKLLFYHNFDIMGEDIFFGGIGGIIWGVEFMILGNNFIFNIHFILKLLLFVSLSIYLSSIKKKG